ncbi:MAG TPA: hypothetical protein VF821_09390 [Lentzea sp.]
MMGVAHAPGWLEAARRMGATRERERILGLLESHRAVWRVRKSRFRVALLDELIGEVQEVPKDIE